MVDPPGSKLSSALRIFSFSFPSVDGKARFPEGSEEITITVVSMVTQWILLAIGLAVALLALPMFVFFIARGMSKRVDAGATARFAAAMPPASAQ